MELEDQRFHFTPGAWNELEGILRTGKFIFPDMLKKATVLKNSVTAFNKWHIPAMILHIL